MSQLMNIHNSYPFQEMYVFWIYNSKGTTRNNVIAGFENNLCNWVVSDENVSDAQ